MDEDEIEKARKEVADRFHGAEVTIDRATKLIVRVPAERD